MTISAKSWKNYVARLSAINSKAGQLMASWIEVNGTADSAALISYAYSLATKYGEAAATLACEMYDATALLDGANVSPAEPAPTATYEETAIAVQGAKKQGDMVIPQAVNRLVKMAGQDTTMLNARRDQAWFAWIPNGDTCSFCLTLASRGWQKQSRKAAKNHAEHIHANCDCAYAVSFSPFGNVEGYDPDKLYEDYMNADGKKPKDKINAMRREHYAANKDKINAQKREAYARRKELEQSKD